MYNVQDYSVLYNDAIRPVICEVGILFTGVKHLYDCTISLRGNGLGPQTRLTQTP